MIYDIILLNGDIVDGTGNSKFIGDIGVKDGKLVFISDRNGGNRLEKNQVQAKIVLDCTGRLICPGWIDVHTHLDGQMTWDPLITPLSGGGVTTAVQGNCGVGFAPCKAQDRKFLMQLMEGVEDIPLGAMDAGIKWEWETFPEYLDVLRKKNFAIDIGALVAHGPVRAYVLGQRANLSDRPGGPKKDPVTKEEMAKIAEVVGEAIRAGAVGFSTSRTLAHRDRSGVLVPGTLASDAELLMIGKAIGENGNGKAIFEMASDFQCSDDVPFGPENHKERLQHFGREFIWMKTMSKGFNVPVCYCLGLPSAARDMAYGYRQMLRTVEMANSDGCKISVQVFTRPQGILMCFESRSHPFTDCPTFDKLWKTRDPISGVFTQKARLWKDPAIRQAILNEAYALSKENNDPNDWYKSLVIVQNTEDDGAGNLNAAIKNKGDILRIHFNNAPFVYKFDKTYEPKPEMSCIAESKRKNTGVLDIMYDWLCENEGNQVITNIFMGYAHENLNDIQEMLVHPNTVPGLGDTGAHLGFLCDPTSPTYLLTHWHRDRTSGPKFPLEFAVKLHSSDTAKLFSFEDRGTIEVGKIADLNVINLEKLEICTPRFVRDLPTGASRWIQEVKGYDFTIKSGVITFENGVPTGRLPGKLINGPGYVTETTLVPETSASMIGNLRMSLSKLKWEGEQKVLEALLLFLGPERLEKVGMFINERLPLTASKL